MNQEKPVDRLFPEINRIESINNKRCINPPIGCGKEITGFKDILSQKEYRISGLCQKCQDEIFKEPLE